MSATTSPWWETAVVYQIYPRSFADSTGTGVGDLPGITARLDHVAELGVDAVWLSPIYRSPMADFGYDISDHCAVDELFGTLADADALIARAHELGLRVVFDVVFNHTSDQHPWFQRALADPTSVERGRYVWRPPAPDGGPPNNWRAAFADVPAWTLDAASGEYYLHLFLSEQPDLDWNHPDVPEAMADVLRFWMDRGVDGFRADVIHCIGKDASLPDAPEDLAALPACIFDHGPGTHAQLRFLRSVVDAEEPSRMLLGETYVFDRAQVRSYLGDGDELHLGFNIPALHAAWDADAWRAELVDAEARYTGGAQPAWALSNHDVARHATRYGSEARARAAAVLLLCLRGTPFLYAGEELGLVDAEIGADQRVDPGGRDGCRAPIPWDATERHGWPSEPWLPFPPGADTHNVDRERGDASSMLELYRRLLRLRRATPALHAGTCEVLDSDRDVLRWRRTDPQGRAVEIEVNFAGETRPASSSGTWIGGTRPEAEPPAPGEALGPDEARITSIEAT